jgi:predicted MFS family arabinose efflux permease
VSAIAAMSALTFGFIERGTYSWGSIPVALPLAVAALLIGTFIAVERRALEPMLPLELFASRLFSSVALVTFLLGFVMLSVPFFTVQFFQDVEHLSAFDAGVRMLSFTLLFSIGAPIAGHLARQWGFRIPIAIGAVLSGVGLLFMAEVSAASAFLDVAWRLALIGGGFSLMLSPLSAATLASIAPHRAGLASSVANMSRQLGTVVGIALLGAVVQTTASGDVAKRLSHVPLSVAGPLSSALGHGGAQLSPSTRLPTGWTVAALERAGAAGYVAGIHAAFVLGGMVMLAAGIAAGAFIRIGRSAANATRDDVAEGAPSARGGPTDEAAAELSRVEVLA